MKKLINFEFYIITLIYPHLCSGLYFWGSTCITHFNKLEILQKKIIRTIANVGYLHHSHPLFEHLKLLNLKQLYFHSLGKFMYAQVNGLYSVPVIEQITRNQENIYSMSLGLFSICLLLFTPEACHFIVSCV